METCLRHVTRRQYIFSAPAQRKDPPAQHGEKATHFQSSSTTKGLDAKRDDCTTPAEPAPVNAREGNMAGACKVATTYFGAAAQQTDPDAKRRETSTTPARPAPVKEGHMSGVSHEVAGRHGGCHGEATSAAQ